MATLLNLYSKFGFEFDHIYAFEVTFEQPSKVYGELIWVFQTIFLSANNRKKITTHNSFL